MPPSESFSLSVPATSANLGSGFDAIGIALGLRLRAEVTPAKRFELAFADGPNAPTRDGYERAILTAMRRIAPALPRVSVRVDNRIPLGKGLGSSAAAYVIGLAIAARAHGVPLDRHALAHHACALEGHPDNVLPAIFGGAVVAASSDVRSFVRLPRTGDLRAVIVIPQIEFSTAASRALLPERYDRADVVFSVQRAALLGAALALGDYRALREAMRDRLHQPYRATRVPGLTEALALRSRALLGIALSGAGPSVIAMLRNDAPWEPIARRIESCFARAGVAVQTLALALGARGIVFGPGA